MKDGVLCSKTYMCTALVNMQLKSTAHLLESTLPPRVILVVTSHGPKQSTPTYVKGGKTGAVPRVSLPFSATKASLVLCDIFRTCAEVT